MKTQLYRTTWTGDRSTILGQLQGINNKLIAQNDLLQKMYLQLDTLNCICGELGKIYELLKNGLPTPESPPVEPPPVEPPPVEPPPVTESVFEWLDGDGTDLKVVEINNTGFNYFELVSSHPWNIDSLLEVDGGVCPAYQSTALEVCLNANNTGSSRQMQIILSQEGTGKLLILRITQPVTETPVEPPPRPRQLAVQVNLFNPLNVERIVANIYDANDVYLFGFTHYPNLSTGSTGVFHVDSSGLVDTDYYRWEIKGFKENGQVHNLLLRSFENSQAVYQSSGASLDVRTYSDPSAKASPEYDFIINLDGISVQPS